MSASSGPLASTKGESTSNKTSKPAYDHLDINKLYKGKSTEPVSKPVTQKHGMQALGKAIPARRPGQTTVKADTPNDVSNSSASQNSSAALAPTNQQSQGNQPPPGWANTHPHPPGPPSPHNVPNVPLTGHVHDKNWSGGQEMVGPYPSQRFAQEFPSLASGADAQKATTANAGGPSSSAQAQSVSKSQDNQYGPGPILRPQTEGSWTQGGGRGMPRPPGPAPPLNAPSREFQGPERANLGGPTPPPMSLGQGGPAPPPLGAYHMPYRGMMPPPYMFPNGPPAPGPGFYPPGARFQMPIPPRAPPPSNDGPRERDQRQRHHHHHHQQQQSARPSSSFSTKPIIKDEDLKRMDEIGGQDGGWASTQDDVDYNKTISFSDEDDGKDSKRSAMKVAGGVDPRMESNFDRDRDDVRGVERRPTKILERQSSANDRDSREGKEQAQLQRFENNAPTKELGPPRPYENEEEWKSQQQQQGLVFPPQQQQRRVNLGFDDKNRDPRDHRDPRERRNDDRGGDRGGRRQNDRREEITDNWRSSNTNRPFEDDGRGNKGAQSRGRDEPRVDPREFPSKSHPNNLPPRLQRQQLQAAPGSGGNTGGPAGPQQQPPQQQQQPNANQRQTPSPGSTGGKDRERDFQSRDWDPNRDDKGQNRRRMDNDPNRKRDPRDRRYYNEFESRNDRERLPEKEQKNSRYGTDFQRERSKESDDTNKSGSSVSSGSAPSSRTTESSRPQLESSPELKSKPEEGTKASGSKPKMSWADEMDDDENLQAQDDSSRKSVNNINKHETQSTKAMQMKQDYYPKPPEERQKRVYIHKNQRKVADMQSQKPEPPVEVKQSSEPTKLESEQVEKLKPLSAWGERENRDKTGKNEKEQSPPQKDGSKFPSSGSIPDAVKEGRKSQEKEISSKPHHQQHQNQSGNAQSGLSSQKGDGVNNRNMESLGGNQQHDQGFNKSAMITKSSSGRSIGGDVDSVGSHRSLNMDQRNSLSDASDRDHLDRDSISSQENRSKASRHGVADGKSLSSAPGGENGKSKHRAIERERREKTISERDGGSDVGSEHGGSHRGEKSQRGQRNRERGTYPVHRGGRDRPGWDRPRSRGSRGRGGSHYYDKPASKRSDSEREHQDREDILDKQLDIGSSKLTEVKDEKREKVDGSISHRGGNNISNKKDQHSGDENQRPKKDKELITENMIKKGGKSTSSNKRGSNSSNARGGGKLEGYGPPSDQKPFSNLNKEDDPDKKDKLDLGQSSSGAKEGGIPSLMAVDISPPSMSQLKKGHRDREFHSGGRSGVPPRLQNPRGGDTYPERERYGRNSGKRGKGDAPPSSNMSLSQKKTEGEDSEEWTDNDSDSESRKSGSTSNKSRKDSSSKAPGAEKNRQSQKVESLSHYSRGSGNAPGRNANTMPASSMITLGSSLPQMMMMSNSCSTTPTTSTSTINTTTNTSIHNILSNSNLQDSTNNNVHSSTTNKITGGSRSRISNISKAGGAGSSGNAATIVAVTAAGGEPDMYAKSLNASTTTSSSSSFFSSATDSRIHLMSDNNEHIPDNSGGHQDIKRKNNQIKPEKGFGSSGAPSKPTGTVITTTAPNTRNGSDKGGKTIRVKNPPYEARSVVHSNNLPPRFANKRDTHPGPTGSLSTGNGKPLESGANPPKGIEPAAPPSVNAWEKPIAPAFRPDQNSQPNMSSSNSNASTTSHTTTLESKDSKDMKLSGVGAITGGNVSSGGSTSTTTTTVAAAVLDGTNPPSHTMIFENRKLKSGFAEANSNTKTSGGASRQLPDVKKDSVPSTGIEFGKNLGSLGFGKGEDSPELDFRQSPFDDPPNVPQSQPAPTSMMTTHHHTSSPKTASILQQSSRHYDHQPSPISPCAAELTEKIQSVKRVWENPSMPSVPEQTNVCGPEENAFHAAFSSDTFKGSSDTSNRDFGPSSLPPSAVGYSGGNSPSMAAMANPDSRSSPNANIRPPSKGPQQQPPVTKAQGHGGLPTAFGSYGIEPPQHISANNYGVPVVAPPNKIMYTSKVVPLDPFGSQFAQYPNASAQCGPSPYTQGGNVLIRPLEPKYPQQLQYQQQQQQQQHGGQNRSSGQGSNHNSVSPGPITSSAGGNSAGGGHINSRNTMMQKNAQQNRNAGHTHMSQPVHQQGYYHTHNPMAQQQVPKGAFGPANGGYSEGGLTAAYQPQILIPVDVNSAMFNISGNYESSDLRGGPPPPGPAPPGTPPVQGSSSYYFGSNNNPACVFPPSSTQNFGLQFTATSLKMPGFNSTGGNATDTASNLASQRIRPSEQTYIQPGLETLPQNALKSQHEYLMSQQRWNSANDFSVNPGIHWSAPGPIQRPIYNTPSAGPVGMQMVHSHSSSHYMPQSIGPPPGHVGVKPNNSSNESMTNPGTPPKSPHPRKNI